MRFNYRYYGATSVDNSASSTAMRFAPDVLRPPTYFIGDVNRRLPFREAISALHDVVVADERYQAPDKSAYKAWLAENETALLARFQARSDELRARQAPLLEELKALRARKAAVLKPFQQAEAKFYRYLYVNDRTMWLVLDPIITVHPDSLFFEAFSRDESSYASLSCSHDVFDHVGDFACGTTNIDYSEALYGEFQKIRDYKSTRLAIDPGGFQVQTANDPGFVEQKIDVPESWVRGFLQVSSAMAMPARRVDLHPMDMHNFCLVLRRRRERVGPRAIRFILVPGEPVRAVFEPWNLEVVCRRSLYQGGTAEEIRIWGRRRLLVLERLIPLARTFTVHLMGTGMPSFWIADLPDMRFTLGLSGWTASDWSRAAQFDLLAPRGEVDADSKEMSNPTTSREALYERIRATSRTQVTLEEMQRLGFWPADDEIVSVEADLIRRETELNQALQALGSELREIEDPVMALKRMRKERMAQAKLKREETRQRRARERHERALAWHTRRARELLYLGDGVSAGLNDTRSDADKLARLALPGMHDAQALAHAMGLSLPELRFLAFERRVSRISHYRRFAMPKKTGGERIISAPMPRLKRAQYWVLDNILARAPLHPAAHGFTKNRSIVSNAAPHIGRAVVINVDLKDFFPSIAMPRVKGVFRQLGYSEQVAATLALLCTESATETVLVDGETFHVAHGPRTLPQGAPSSPALTNILCRRLDARLQGAAAKLGFDYTRYADDLTFSAHTEGARLAGKLLWRVRQIIIDEGFTPHPAKQHVMRSSARQSVTGIVVNEKAAVDRTTLHRFRATLFQVEKDGPVGKQWNGNDNVLSALEGYAHFVQMVDAAKGQALVLRVRAARIKWAEWQRLRLLWCRFAVAGHFVFWRHRAKLPGMASGKRARLQHRCWSKPANKSSQAKSGRLQRWRARPRTD